VETVRALGPETIVELGAGAGALTFALLDAGLSVCALEIDPRLVDLLEKETAGRGATIERADLAREDLGRFVGSRPTVFAGNLPYQVTSPVLFGLIPALRRSEVRGAVLMIQAEVANRLLAAPGTKAYGVLSVLIGAELSVRRVLAVKPGCFLPPPDVDSAVVELRPRADARPVADSTRQLVRDLFQQRRKQIGGLLKRQHGLEDAEVEDLSEATGVDARARAENLVLDDFLRLDRWLLTRGGGR
jgi:16S rRNA (adenine1518-N6/adenine1519-N6)-dimethyltransferase